MSGKNINFEDRKKIKKSNFNKNKNVFKVDDIDVNKILVSKKEPYGTNKSIKYFIGYNVDNCYQTTMSKTPSNNWIC